MAPTTAPRRRSAGSRGSVPNPVKVLVRFNSINAVRQIIAICYVGDVRVISDRNVIKAARRHPRSVAPASRWCFLMSLTDAANLVELRRTFASVDQAGNTLIFNIGGNNYRLLCCVSWARQTLHFRALLTHADYDRVNLEDLCP